MKLLVLMALLFATLLAGCGPQDMQTSLETNGAALFKGEWKDNLAGGMIVEFVDGSAMFEAGEYIGYLGETRWQMRFDVGQMVNFWSDTNYLYADVYESSNEGAEKETYILVTKP